MPQQPYDQSSKWLLEHHGKALAFLGGLTDADSQADLHPTPTQKLT